MQAEVREYLQGAVAQRNHQVAVPAIAGLVSALQPLSDAIPSQAGRQLPQAIGHQLRTAANEMVGHVAAQFSPETEGGIPDELDFSPWKKAVSDAFNQVARTVSTYDSENARKIAMGLPWAQLQRVYSTEGILGNSGDVRSGS
jgi:hypothetical protein